MANKKELNRMVKELMKEKGWSESRARREISLGVWGSKFSSPVASDVHINQPMGNEDEKKQQRKKDYEGELFTVMSMPIFKAGVWHGETFTVNDLDEIVKNTNALIKASFIEPPIKLGHDENQKLLQSDGLPAGGYVSNVYRVGDEIFCDVIDVPKQVHELIDKRAYKHVSAEIYQDFPHPVTKENIGRVLRAVALLGADTPEVKGLGDIIAQYHTEKIAYAMFSENDLQEAYKMGTKWTLEQVKGVLPCCFDAVKTYMETNKLTEIDADVLAEVVTADKMKKYDTEAPASAEGGMGGSDKPKECPPSYKWDEEEQKCVLAAGETSDTKPEEQKICPAGMVWDEKSGKCVNGTEQTFKTDKPTAKGLMASVMKALGYTIDDKKDIDEQLPSEKDMMDKLSEFMKKDKPSADDKQAGEPKDWKPEDIDNMKTKYEADTDPDKDKMADDKKPPKGWFDSCTSAVKDKTDSPKKLCGWIYAHGISDETKSKAEATRQAEVDPKITELKEKIRSMETKQYTEKIKETVEKNRGILLPALDPYIETFTKEFTEAEEKVIKFKEGDKETEVTNKEMFIKFLNTIVTSKMLVFEEMLKTHTPDKDKEQVVDISDEEKLLEAKKYAEHSKGKEIEGIDLHLLAVRISSASHLPYKEALIKAGKQLRASK
jgi:hypothetical protein